MSTSLCIKANCHLKHLMRDAGCYEKSGTSCYGVGSTSLICFMLRWLAKKSAICNKINVCQILHFSQIWFYLFLLEKKGRNERERYRRELKRQFAALEMYKGGNRIKKTSLQKAITRKSKRVRFVKLTKSKNRAAGNNFFFVEV